MISHLMEYTRIGRSGQAWPFLKKVISCAHVDISATRFLLNAQLPHGR